jgi:iron(III) transport system substrate-binding protein
MAQNGKSGWKWHQMELSGQLIIFYLPLAVLFLVLIWLAFQSVRKPSVVVYTSQDQVYSEPIFHEFTRRTGIRVRAVFDSEAVKTVGLANRLLAERRNPQCDVFWNNELLRTYQLAAADVFREENGWKEFGYRSRRIVFNTDRLQPEQAPSLLMDLTNSFWRGRIALAYPLFGTTATHFLALRQAWGEERWLEWIQGLQANQPMVVDGNSVVVRMVGKGEAWVGLTDSDDIAAAQREGMPVAAAPITEDSLLIPNTVGVIRGAPNPDAAEQMFQFLQRRDIIEMLVEEKGIEGHSPKEVQVSTLQPDYAALADELEHGTKLLKQLFLR